MENSFFEARGGGGGGSCPDELLAGPGGGKPDPDELEFLGGGFIVTPMVMLVGWQSPVAVPMFSSPMMVML
jgi:hypothetical protein